jgi:hypothetical protein
MVVIMTPRSEASASVAQEVTRAQVRDLPILPVLLEGDPFATLHNLPWHNVCDGRLPGRSFVDDLRDLRRRASSTARPMPTATKVFLCYRRVDSAIAAHWLYQLLTGSLIESGKIPAGSLFLDMQSIEAAQNFPRRLATAIEECHAFVALIGDRWNPSRLRNPTDVLRQEIEFALTVEGRVVPVLIDRAKMPEPDQLPEAIRELAALHALPLRPDSFLSDAADIAKVVGALIK